MNKYLVECCANSIKSAINGELAGANRIELCQKLEVGGVTPLKKDIKKTKELLKIPIHVLISPKIKNFIYTKNEYKQIITDIGFCKKTGCEGIVIGALNKDRSINIKQIKKIVKIARPMHVTFHRAFDEANDLLKNLEDVIASGCDSLLTSGQAKTVTLGLKNLDTLIKMAKGRINILAGSGVNHSNIESLFNIGIRNFHLSGSTKNKQGVLETKRKKIEAVVKKIKQIA